MCWSSKSFALSVALILGLGACAEPEDASSPELERGLVLDADGSTATGSFANEDHAVRFWAELSDAGFELRIELNGMTITATKDDEGNFNYDGFASQSGEPTQMTEADRAALAALADVLDELGPGVEAPVDRLRSFADMWSEFPSTLELRGQVDAGFRSYTSICSSMNSYVQTTHDDWNYDRWEDRSTYYAYVSMTPEGPCSDGTWFWKDGSWKCYEPDHDPNVEYAYGNCFGRCGGGCGSSSQMTYDCLDHDACVRFGHDLASFWCDDEFSSTVDDWASAPDCL
jgi:hypothetical protein